LQTDRVGNSAVPLVLQGICKVPYNTGVADFRVFLRKMQKYWALTSV